MLAGSIIEPTQTKRPATTFAPKKDETDQIFVDLSAVLANRDRELRQR